MPLYEYECPNCKVKVETHRAYERRNEPIVCVDCEMEMVYQFPLPQRYNEEPLDEETKAAYEEIEKM